MEFMSAIVVNQGGRIVEVAKNGAGLHRAIELGGAGSKIY